MIAYAVKIFIFILCCACCFIIVPAWADNQNIDEINELLKKEKNELRKLKKKIKKQTRALAKMGKKKYSILKKQRILDDQLKSRERELEIYNWNLKINTHKIKNLTLNIKKNKILNGCGQ